MNIPIEIIYMILNHICYPQPAILLKDVTSYTQALICVGQCVGQVNGLIKHKLMNYANDGVPLMFGVQPKFKNILLRFFTKTKEIKFGPSTVNILLGLFTPVEREEFVRTIA